MKKTILLSALFLLSSHVILFSQESKEDKIFKEKFIEYINVTNMKDVFVNTITGSLEETLKNPNIQEEQKKMIEEFIGKIKGITQTELLEILLPPYKSKFSSKELSQITKFYTSEIGKKLSDNQIQISKDIKTNSDKFAQKIAQEIMAKYQEEMKAKEEKMAAEEKAKNEKEADKSSEKPATKTEIKKPQTTDNKKKEIKK